jgi:formiminotetrahydrofolate cyclodeaminase
MSKIKKQTTEIFLNELASDLPAPGGGSVAALMGAYSAALTSMVCRLTIGKKKYKAVEKEMKRILKESEKMRKEFVELAEKDKDSFFNVVKSKYSKASLKKAAAVPGKTARLAEKMIKLAETAKKKGNKNTITDAKIAVDLAKAAKRGAILNVKVNL